MVTASQVILAMGSVQHLLDTAYQVGGPRSTHSRQPARTLQRLQLLGLQEGRGGGGRCRRGGKGGGAGACAGTGARADSRLDGNTKYLNKVNNNDGK